jgi:hypothetical protein
MVLNRREALTMARVCMILAAITAIVLAVTVLHARWSKR